MEDYRKRFEVKLNYLVTNIDTYPKMYRGLIIEEIKVLKMQLDLFKKMENASVGEPIEI